MRSSSIRCTTLALITAGVALANPFAPAAQAAPAAKVVATSFAFAASGFGTEARGGQVPAGSGQTAYQAIGCTTNAGVLRENHQAALPAPGLGTLHGVSTRVWTSRSGSVVSSYAKHSIARLTLSESSLGRVDLSAINSLSRAFHDSTGYHSATTTRVGSITFVPASGDPTTFPTPSAGQPTTIPGVATISVGRATRTQGSTGARATADALAITMLPTDTRARVAHTAAEISGGVKSGIFGGHGSATRARGLANSLTSGPTPLQLMPCQGTHGVVKTRSIAHLKLADNIAVDGLFTRQMGQQTAAKATGTQVGSVAAFNLDAGQLVVKGIVGRANVERTAHGLVRTATGTKIGQVLVNGQVRSFPATGVLEIPGVARLENRHVTRLADGIMVTALRIRLLDGSGAVIDLGQARLTIRPSGL